VSGQLKGEIMKKLFLFILIFFCVTTVSYAATPIVSGGSNSTVSGSNFGSHADYHANVGGKLAWVWQNFENSITYDGLDYYGDAASYYTRLTSGGRSGYWIQRSGNSNNRYIQTSHDSFNTNTFYMSFWSYVPTNADDGKTMRFAFNGWEGTNYWYNLTNGAVNQEYEFLDYGALSSYPKGQWVRIEMLLKGYGSGHSQKFWFTGHNNNSPVYSASYSSMQIFNTTQLIVGAGYDSSTGYWGFDDVYANFTQARVELCAESSWSSRNHCEIQIVSAWSDSNITYTLNQGTFQNGNTAYLYVVNEDGDANSTGRAITIGGEAPTYHTLTVNKTITEGDGSITSNPDGIDCAVSTCTSDTYDFLEGTPITLSSDGNPRVWGQDCASDGTVTMTANKTCTAVYSASQQYTLTITKDETNGSGIITSTPGNIDCGAPCFDAFDQDSDVSLSVSGAFVEWGGDCIGNDNISINMGTSIKNCTATFTTSSIWGPVNITDDANDGAEVDDATWQSQGRDGDGNDVSHKDGSSYDTAWKWDNVGIAKDVTILSAELIIQGTYEANEGHNAQLKGIGDCTAFASSRPSQQFSTVATVSWSMDLSEFNSSGFNTSPDLKTILQEIVDDPAWSSGDSLCLVWENLATTEHTRQNGDVGRGHTGASLEISYSTSEPPPPIYYTLTVEKTITNGDGSITSDPEGIDCVVDTCTQDTYDFEDGTPVSLSSLDTDLVIWGGACASDGTVTMDAPKTCTAEYYTTHTLTVYKDGTGDGLLLADSGVINCGLVCSDDYVDNTSVVITASADQDSVFTSWSDGDCDEVDGLNCTIYMGTVDQDVTAVFTATTSITCDPEHYYACDIEVDCTNQGFYWWESACRTIPEPDDWTGDDAITNGDFSGWTDGMPDNWSTYSNETRVVEHTFGVELQTIATDGQTHVYQSYGETGVPKSYRYIINFIENTGTVEAYTASDDPNTDEYTGVGTMSGIMTYDGTSDSNVYLALIGGDVNNTIIGDIIIKELTSAQPVSVDISWIPNSEEELRGYNIHSGSESEVYTDTLDVGIPTTEADGRVHYTMNNIPEEDVLCVAVSAYGRAEDTESAFSDEDCYNTIILPPTSFIIGSIPTGF